MPDRFEDKAKRWATEIDRIHASVLEALRESQPLVVLSSLSLVIGAFTASIAPAAVPYAVSASVSFLAALLVTVLSPPGRKIDAAMRLQLSGLALTSMAVGFLMLFQ